MEKKLNIGIVCYPTYGGSGVVATELGVALAKKGHSIHFITYKQPFRLEHFQHNITYHEVSFQNYSLFEYPPYETALASRMVDVAKFENLDLFHVHYAIPHASAAYIAQNILKSQGIDVPFVTTLHGTDITLVGKEKAFQPVVEFSINQSNTITSVSNSLKKDTLRHFNIKKDINVVHNFIDLVKFQKSEKNHFKKLIAENDEKVLIHVSNFRKVKRAEDVVKVFEYVSKKVDAKLLMVGDGPERNNCEDLCRKLHLCDDIRFLGKQENVAELYAIADLMVLPSESESFGLAALEAMACEVPVVCNRTGGLPELIQEHVNGLMSPVGDIDQMGENAVSILSNDEELANYKLGALNTARQFDIKNILPLYEDLYLKTIQ